MGLFLRMLKLKLHPEFVDLMQEFYTGRVLQALRAQPALFEAVLLLARTEHERNRLHEAEGHYRRLIGLRPDCWLDYSNPGAFYYRIGRYAEAARLFEQGSLRAPKTSPSIAISSPCASSWRSTIRPRWRSAGC